MDKPNAGIELVVGYVRGIRRVTPDSIILSLSHPRFGELNYLLLVSEVEGLVTALQAAAGPVPIPSPLVSTAAH